MLLTNMDDEDDDDEDETEGPVLPTLLLLPPLLPLLLMLLLRSNDDPIELLLIEVPSPVELAAPGALVPVLLLLSLLSLLVNWSPTVTAPPVPVLDDEARPTDAIPLLLLAEEDAVLLPCSRTPVLLLLLLGRSVGHEVLHAACSGGNGRLAHSLVSVSLCCTSAVPVSAFDVDVHTTCRVWLPETDA